MLFIVLALASAVVAIWVVIGVPALPVLPRQRYTVADLARQLTGRAFLLPVTALAVAGGALGAAVGFLPLIGTRIGLGIPASIAVISVMAIASSVAQPLAGRLRDSGKLRPRTGIVGGIALIALSFAAGAMLPNPIALYVVALFLGVGIGITTTLGFAQLAATTPVDRLGRTMGTAEPGREIGDAGGPLVIGAVAVGAGLSAGLVVFAVIAAASGAIIAALAPKPRVDGEHR
jgi:MFS family permease